MNNMNLEELQTEEQDKLKFWVTFWEHQTDRAVLHHAVGYEKMPTQHDLDHIKEEVRSDPEFALGDLVDKLDITVIGPDDGDLVDDLKKHLFNDNTN